MNLTDKQIEIMKIVVAAMPDAADLDQILETLPYTTTKASLQFSIRALERHKLIERNQSATRRARVRRLITPTVLGAAMANGTGRPAPGPGEPVTPAVKSKPMPRKLAKEVQQLSENLPEPQLLSLPELDFSEPQLLELQTIDL